MSRQNYVSFYVIRKWDQALKLRFICKVRHQNHEICFTTLHQRIWRIFQVKNQSRLAPVELLYSYFITNQAHTLSSIVVLPLQTYSLFQIWFVPQHPNVFPKCWRRSNGRLTGCESIPEMRALLSFHLARALILGMPLSWGPYLTQMNLFTHRWRHNINK